MLHYIQCLYFTTTFVHAGTLNAPSNHLDLCGFVKKSFSCSWPRDICQLFRTVKLAFINISGGKDENRARAHTHTHTELVLYGDKAASSSWLSGPFTGRKNTSDKRILYSEKHKTKYKASQPASQPASAYGIYSLVN